ncbi:ATP-binding cassette domain-containing protein [Nakamurella sp. YIM 132087]|uniref:ATP-binding cassette domain-containing protein n=1 Tax=Nakamurella alba TaxID=2665158 RepID=A0A7K1FJ13_9ACTN|nr:ABC transporter ATP-binding protein [Nakamurella alba]MTD12874.1 ATP-binding cassette domain-containing protein [Nakamurella alba]
MTIVLDAGESSPQFHPDDPRVVPPLPEPAATPRVQLDRVSKVYRGSRGTVPALDTIDLSVAPGEFVCLLGASGCGKSTLLNLIAGLDRPSAGTVTAEGRPALMFQESALFPWLTAGQNISLALKLAGVARSDRPGRVEELLELVRLPGTASRRVHELSGGQRQRVALARALAQDGSVLLMDEPFAALDAITRDVMHDELTRIWKRTGSSVVFVTHNVREAVRLGQRVVLLSSRPGRIVGQWAVDIAGPRTIEHPEVAGLAAEITVRLREEIASHARTR